MASRIHSRALAASAGWTITAVVWARSPKARQSSGLNVMATNCTAWGRFCRARWKAAARAAVVFPRLVGPTISRCGSRSASQPAMVLRLVRPRGTASPFPFRAGPGTLVGQGLGTSTHTSPCSVYTRAGLSPMVASIAGPRRLALARLAAVGSYRRRAKVKVCGPCIPPTWWTCSPLLTKAAPTARSSMAMCCITCLVSIVFPPGIQKAPVESTGACKKELVRLKLSQPGRC